MRRGVLAVPERDVGALETVESETRTQQARGSELVTAINVKEEQTLSGETSYYYGEALRESQEENDEFYLEDGSIRKRTSFDKIQEFTTFVAVPESENHRGFMLVSSSSGTFAFGMVSSQNAALRLGTAKLNLGSFYEHHEEEFTPETSGGRASSEDHGTSKMTAWGDDVLQTKETAKLLSGSIRHDDLNQLAGSYLYEEPDGSVFPYEVNLAASGYVEVWDPSDITTREFLEWVEREILPYANAKPDDEDTEQTEVSDS